MEAFSYYRNIETKEDMTLTDCIMAVFKNDVYIDKMGIPRFVQGNRVAIPPILQMWHSNGAKFDLELALATHQKEKIDA